LRAAPKGVLLDGPPGTGKTMIGTLTGTVALLAVDLLFFALGTSFNVSARCIASQCDSSFLNVSASKLTSKWVGDGEKAVQALFGVARCDGAALSQEADNVLVIGATSRPDDLDEAIRRRFQKRFMIPLPDNQGRLQILKAVLAHEKIANSLEGYSGADIAKVCAEASMTPVREWSGFLETVELSEIRAIELHDMMEAAERVKPSVSVKDLSHYEDFHKLYGDKP
ncbi:hypothetical protein FOCC_FOCC014249, partial [Frankliniella occidentalis]